MTAHADITSPRLARLQRDLAAGDIGALETFWREVARDGAPLIEPLKDDGDADEDQHALVTFLWRGHEGTRNVLVIQGPAGWSHDFSRMHMALLPGSDVWYRTYRVRNDLRTTYQLSSNDPLTPFDEVENWEQREAAFQTDPLNPHRYVFPRDEEIPGDKEYVLSVVELPGAPRQPWAIQRPDVRAGQVEMRRVRSEILGNERRVWVYTPPGYAQEGAPYGLVLLFDGFAYLHVVPTPATLDNLLADRRLPPLVAVLVDSLGARRSQELPCYQPFADFLARELLPWIREHYLVTREPAKTIVGGSSYGGLAAAYVALQHPDLFGGVLSQSGWYSWPDREHAHGWLIRQYVERPRLPLRFYLDVGLLENQRTHGEGPSPLHANRHMRDVLLAKGYSVHYIEHNSGHDYLVWRGSLADGLLALLGEVSSSL